MSKKNYKKYPEEIKFTRRCVDCRKPTNDYRCRECWDKKRKNEKNNTVEAPVYVPVHMRGADEIAAVFGVSRETVIRWAKDGAPIRIVGKKYQARYDQLWDWILKKVKS